MQTYQEPCQEHFNFKSLVIEAWVPAHCVITPSLIVHNLELQGIQLSAGGMTITIDRGHYDYTGANYTVIVVQTQDPITSYLRQSQEAIYCSFFSRDATRGMDPSVLEGYWLGNCYLHLGGTGALCSFRHESGHMKTWRKVQDAKQSKQCVNQDQDQEDAVSVGSASVGAVSVDPVIPKKNSKDNIRIIRLQKKNFLLRTEMDLLKAEFSAMKTEFSALAQRYKDQEAWVSRANQCMQDWANQQVIERIRILETKYAETKYAETQCTELKQSQSKCKCKCKSKKDLKKLSKRVEFLENMNALNDCKSDDGPINYIYNNNDSDGGNGNGDSNGNYIDTNPFDFSTIYDYYYTDHYSDYFQTQTYKMDDNECPALDLISTHYADFDMPVTSVDTLVAMPAMPTTTTITELNVNSDDTINTNINSNGNNEDDDYDEDLFELIQVESFHDFPLPEVK